MPNHVTDINVCDTILFSLAQIKKVEAFFTHLRLFKFCAYIRIVDRAEWNGLIGPGYTGPLALCEAIVKILCSTE